MINHRKTQLVRIFHILRKKEIVIFVDSVMLMQLS